MKGWRGVIWPSGWSGDPTTTSSFIKPGEHLGTSRIHSRRIAFLLFCINYNIYTRRCFIWHCYTFYKGKNTDFSWFWRICYFFWILKHKTGVGISIVLGYSSTSTKIWHEFGGQMLWIQFLIKSGSRALLPRTIGNI